MTLPLASKVERPLAFGFDVQIDSLLFRLAVGPGRQLNIEDAPVEPPRIDTSENPEEFSATSGRTFARSDFTGGEGLDYAHRRDAPDDAARRYWQSSGLDIRAPEPGERREVTLLTETRSILTLTGTGQRIVATDTLLAIADGQNVKVCTDPEAETPTWTTEDPHAGQTAAAVLSLAVLGEQVYAAIDGSGIHRRAANGTWAHHNDGPSREIWEAESRLLASEGRSLFEIDTSDGAAPGQSTALLYRLPVGDEWVGAYQDGLILAAGTDGFVRAFTANDAGELTVSAQTPFPNEIPTCIGGTRGRCFVGTTDGSTGRLWVMEVADDGRLVGGQVVREWDTAPVAIVVDRESVYALVNEATESSVWRFDLVTSAISRSYGYAGIAGADLAMFDGRPVAVLEGVGVFAHGTQYVEDGWIIGPIGDFFDTNMKSWVAAVLSGTANGGTIDLYYSLDPEDLSRGRDGNWIKAASIEATRPALDETPLRNVQGRAIAGMVVLTAPVDRLTSPALRAFGFRAFRSDPQQIVELPINVSDWVEVPGRAPLRSPGRGEEVYRALMALRGRSVLLRLLSLGDAIRGQVEYVGVPMEAMPARGYPTLYSLLRIRGARTSLTSGVSGEGTYGSAMYGNIIFGGPDG